METGKEAQRMTGAEVVLRTAIAAGIDACFANPGTTELPLVQALDRCPAIRPVLAVFEGVCTGAADGYTRISGRPALALLHLVPGLANGLANLHNARKAGSPVVSIVGEHATWHIAANAPLTSDIAGLARPMSRFVHTTTQAESAAADMAEVIAQATRLPSGPATLILPGDVQWAQVAAAPVTAKIPAPPSPNRAETERAARALRSGTAALVLGGRALRAPGLRAAERIARATGCRVLAPTFPPVQNRGAGLLSPARIPYPPEPARQLLAPYRTVVLAGAGEPVAFFGYPNSRSGLCAEGADIVPLCSATVDPAAALLALAEMLGAPPEREVPTPPRPQAPHGALTGRLLAPVMEYNYAGEPERFARIAQALGLDTSNKTVWKAAEVAVEYVYQLTEDLDIPSLNELGFAEDEIPMLAKKAEEDSQTIGNPRDVDAHNYEKIYARAFEAGRHRKVTRQLAHAGS